MTPEWVTRDWVTVAVLGKPRGNRGELTAVSLSSHLERFQALGRVYLFGSGESFEVENVWDHEGTLVFKFRGVDSIEDAEKLRGAEVRIPGSERARLESGEFYHSDLIGCEVREQKSDRRIGSITGVEEFGGPALLVIDHGRILVPFVSAICVDIRPENRLVRVEMPQGLENLDAPE